MPKKLKRKNAKYPYEEYYLYVVFHKGEGRWYANLVPKDKKNGPKRKTISYARYLMATHLGRELTKDEQVDHINDDKTDDRIENLQILTLAENNKKEALRHYKTAIKIKCPWCGKIFYKKKANFFTSIGGYYTTCSPKCSRAFQTYYDNPKTHKDAIKRVEESYLGKVKQKRTLSFNDL